MENEMREKKPVGSDSAKPTAKVKGGKSFDDRAAAAAGQMVERATGNVFREKTEEPQEPQTYSTGGGAKSGAGSKKAGKDTGSKGDKSAAVKRSNIIVQVLNGDILTRDFVLNNLTFVFFILFLLLLMVGKGYYGKQLTKDINDLQMEVDAETAEYIENKAKLEEETARFRLVKALERRGLKETVNPAKVIRIKQPE